MKLLKRIGAIAKLRLTEFRISVKKAPSVLVTIFVLSVVCMNVLANKSINFDVSWFALDCGIIVSGIAFLAMDILTIKYGPKLSINISIFATLCNLGVALIFAIAKLIPGTWGEAFNVPSVITTTLYQSPSLIINQALDNTIGGTWFILFGSTVAFLASAILNAIMNYGIGKIVKAEGKLNYCLRCYVSTVIAQFVDNLIFALIVSHFFFGWTIIQCLSCAATGALFELVMEIIFSPLGYKICKKEE